jgi:hypothetical protein
MSNRKQSVNASSTLAGVPREQEGNDQKRQQWLTHQWAPSAAATARREETIRTVRDAAINAWIDRMDDGAWLAATLRRLHHSGHLAQGSGGRV